MELDHPNSGPARALVAFDKFKDALTARETCRIAAQALASRRPDWEIEIAPLADGGDGFCDTLAGVLKGEFHGARVTGPCRSPVDARYGMVANEAIPESAQTLLDWQTSPDRVAVIEMAETSGIALTPLGDRSPWTTTSAGLGQLIRAASERGADAAIVGLGGSATHDIALGALGELGYRFLNSDDDEIDSKPIPDVWPQISRIVGGNTVLPTTFEIRLACDVENPLLGELGAAAIFGPQKGLVANRLQELEDETNRLAGLLLQATGEPGTTMEESGAGAAGGAAFGLKSGLGARIIPGYELVKFWIGLDEKFKRSELVLTGEGRFDESSLHGKGPGALSIETLSSGKDLFVFAGSVGQFDDCPIPGNRLAQITPPNMPIEEALRSTESNLIRAIQDRFQ